VTIGPIGRRISALALHSGYFVDLLARLQAAWCRRRDLKSSKREISRLAFSEGSLNFLHHSNILLPPL